MIKNSYRRLWLLILTFGNTTAFAQTEEIAVKQAINNFFEGMKKSDTSIIRAAFSSKPILQTIAKNREGNAVIVTDHLDSLLASIASPHEIYDERITFDVVKVDADMAMAWTPYRFYLGDKFSHCGVNSFQLVRLNGQWKIQYLIDTRRREGCD